MSRRCLCCFTRARIAAALVVLYCGLIGDMRKPLLAQSVPNQRISSIGFQVVDVYGEVLPYRVVSLTQSSDARVNYGERFRVLSAEGIPFGEYSYRLQRVDIPNIAQLDGNVSVNRSQMWKTVVYHGGPIGFNRGRPGIGDFSIPTGIVITGVIRPHTVDGRKRWVRLQSFYENVVFEMPVDEHGGFRLEKFIMGNYLLSIFDGGQLVYMVPLTFRIGDSSPDPIIIDLSSSAPNVITVK